MLIWQWFIYILSDNISGGEANGRSSTFTIKYKQSVTHRDCVRPLWQHILKNQAPGDVWLNDGSWDWPLSTHLTYTIVCISACELYCAVMFSFRILFVFFVFSFRIKTIHKAIIQQVNLQTTVTIIYSFNQAPVKYQHFSLCLSPIYSF